MRIHVQGRDAERAAAELVALSQGAARLTETSTPKDHKDPVSAAAAVVGILAGSAALADQMVRWCRRWRDGGARGSGPSVERIVVVVADRGQLLENLGPEDLERLFRQASADPDPGPEPGPGSGSGAGRDGA
ncbi:hypothetical protein ABT390_23845 [Streptomyces aurantiacus]|uniref:hypothetical protein n=1 Tax=Streptomyces aurantiacus TaxID=47760 RepID=UPI00131A2154|nr:hypothetical protein [Streptomyces aurantiacus]